MERESLGDHEIQALNSAQRLARSLWSEEFVEIGGGEKENIQMVQY